MKTKDIIVGHEYAIGAPNSDWRVPRRAKVIATGVPREADRWRYRAVGTSVKVDWCGSPSSRYKDDVVPPAHVLRTWDEQERIDAASAKANAEAKAKLQKEKAAAAVDFAWVASLIPEDASDDVRTVIEREIEYGGTKVRLTADQLRRLVVHARAAAMREVMQITRDLGGAK